MLLAGLLGLSVALGQVVMDRFATFQSCPGNLPETCTNSTPIENTCCFEAPGGIMLQTQFWDYYPPIGKADAFTLHGLWPDNCDGSYEQFCRGQLNIERGDIERIISLEFKDYTLFSQIKESWKNFNGDDEQLWVHEYNKHATCIKTLWPECYGASFKRHENVYDFFKIAVDLYEQYPTFKFLAAAGIEPSTSKTYTRAQIANALSAGFGGHKVYFKCNRDRALQEIWYYHHLRGPLKNQQFVQIDAMLDSNCPVQGIKFLPKGKYSSHPDPPQDPGRTSGHVRLSAHPGCLISNGQFYQHGTCATFRIEDLQFGGYNLISSKGVCGVNGDGEIFCNNRNQRLQYQFTYDEGDKTLSYGGKSDWCFNNEHKHGTGRFQQIPVMVGNGNCDSFKLKFG